MELTYLPDVTTLRLTEENCTGCTLCTRVCPRGVFEMREKLAHIVNRDACIECGACALNCAFGALSVRSGVGCASGILSGILGRESDCSVTEDCC
jgi:Fe-S-cluster-containing hydrogenase component 2